MAATYDPDNPNPSGAIEAPKAGDGTTIPSASDPTRIPAEDANSSTRTIIQKLAARKSALLEKVKATRNWQEPKPEKPDGSDVYVYLSAPERLKRIFDSPLHRTGKWVVGRYNVRKLREGWGAAAYARTLQTGLNYYAEYGEDVITCAGGRVEFVGYIQVPANRYIDITDAHQDEEQNVLGAQGDIVAHKNRVGNGGIVIRVRHNGDFFGYLTEYFNLSSVAAGVARGKSVVDGQVIGKTGTSGGIKEPQLLVTLSWSNGGDAVRVRPSTLIPNSYDGQLDSTEQNIETWRANFISPGPDGQTLITANAATAAGTTDRSTDLQNTTRKNVTDAQAAHTSYIAQTMGQQERQLYEAMAKYQQSGFVVIDAMTYDFVEGVWKLGEVSNGPV